jgi:hypothetical protein
MSLGVFSQPTNLTPVIKPVIGDTLYTWSHAQAKVIAIALQERTNYIEKAALQDSLIGTYRRKAREQEYLITELEKHKKNVGKLYGLEMQKYQSCEADRIVAVGDRDKYLEKLKKARTKMLIGYGLSAVLFTTIVLK